MTPNLYFVYAGPFDRGRRAMAEAKGLPYPDIKTVRNVMEKWKTIWSEVNADERVMKRLSELTQLSLPYPIEANVFGGLMNPMSFPFLLPVFNQKGEERSRESFLDVCVHELVHRFVSCASPTALSTYKQVVEARYSAESRLTKNHILIYAVLKLILPDFVGRAVWEAHQIIDDPDYRRAFELMGERGAEACLKDFTDCL